MREGVVCLGGFMCSGKTSVGREVARRLGWEFLDTDRLVEERAGMPVPEIFATQGEGAFRRCEFEAVSEALEGERRVVSLGGGALVNEELRALVLSKSRLVVLDVRPETVLRRAEGEEGARPLLDGETVRELMERRAPAYASCHIRIASDESPVNTLADRIVAELRASFAPATGTDTSRGCAEKPSAPA